MWVIREQEYSSRGTHKKLAVLYHWCTLSAKKQGPSLKSGFVLFHTKLDYFRNFPLVSAFSLCQSAAVPLKIVEEIHKIKNTHSLFTVSILFLPTWLHHSSCGGQFYHCWGFSPKSDGCIFLALWFSIQYVVQVKHESPCLWWLNGGFLSNVK